MWALLHSLPIRLPNFNLLHCAFSINHVELHIFPCSPTSLTWLMLFPSLQYFSLQLCLATPYASFVAFLKWHCPIHRLLIALVSCNLFLLSPKTPYMNFRLVVSICAWEKGICVDNLSTQIDGKFFQRRGFYLSLHHQPLESISQHASCAFTCTEHIHHLGLALLH